MKFLGHCGKCCWEYPSLLQSHYTPTEKLIVCRTCFAIGVLYPSLIIINYIDQRTNMCCPYLVKVKHCFPNALGWCSIGQQANLLTWFSKCIGKHQIIHQFSYGYN